MARETVLYPRRWQGWISAPDKQRLSGAINSTPVSLKRKGRAKMIDFQEPVVVVL